MMKVIHTKRGWQVVDDTHVLSEDDLTQDEAKTKMRQLEAYKRRNRTGISTWAKPK